MDAFKLLPYNTYVSLIKRKMFLLSEQNYQVLEEKKQKKLFKNRQRAITV